MIEFLKFYDLENYILTEVKSNFLKNKSLDSFDFFCIIIWKANRAKSKIAKRLLNYGPNLNQAVHDLTSKIYELKNDKDKLKILLEEYKFRLPMASAILSLLYPGNFTIYDVRVCDTLEKYKGLGNLKFEKLWEEYCEYIDCVRNYGTQNLSLKDKDRLLWGKSFYDQLHSDIESNFSKVSSLNLKITN